MTLLPRHHRGVDAFVVRPPRGTAGTMVKAHAYLRKVASGVAGRQLANLETHMWVEKLQAYLRSLDA